MLVGVLLALSLAVVMPTHLQPRLLSTSNPGTGLRAAHHAVIDRAGQRIELRIDRTGRAPGLTLRMPAGTTLCVLRQSLRPAVAAWLAPIPRHLRIAPRARAEDPFSRIASTDV